MAVGHETVAANCEEFSGLIARLQETLPKVINRNEALLEAVESAETRAMESSSSNEMALLRNLRAKLASAHVPNASLRRDLTTFSGMFEKSFQELEVTVKSYRALNQKLQEEYHDLQERTKAFESDRSQFVEEQQKWKAGLEKAKSDIVEQNDRLALLSQQLVGTKRELEIKTDHLASQRIAFEEQQLVHQGVERKVADGEAEALKEKLKVQVLKNVELEKSLLKTEVLLHKHEQVAKELENRNQRLVQEVSQLRLASSRAVKQFERRTTEANKKLAEMNSGLAKAQEHSKRFQELLSGEQRKQQALRHALEQELQHRISTSAKEGISPAAHKAYLDTLTEVLLSVGSKPKNPLRVEDVMRKNEVVLVENSNLRAEVRRLQMENSELMKRVRFADTNAHYMRNQVLTNLHERAELMKKLDKTEQKYRELNGSLMKQAGEWVAQKRRDSFTAREHVIKQIKPVPVLAAYQRTWNTRPVKTQFIAEETQAPLNVGLSVDKPKGTSDFD